jgi:sarcosine oxidase, subunit gamma
MPDLLNRCEAILSDPFVGRGVTISLAPPKSLYSLRARQAGSLEALLGRKVPSQIGGTEGGISCLGPDEWLMLCENDAPIPMGEGLPVAVTNVSERSIGLVVSGPNAAKLLATGCPQDMDQFTIGKASRTIFEAVEVVLIREDQDRFHLEVWRSFAPWLWTALTEAASI